MIVLDKYLIQEDDNLNLTFNKEFNDLYGILSSFMFVSNHNYFKVQIEEKWNLEFDDKMEKDTKELFKKPIFHKAKYFVDMEIQTRDIFINPVFIAKSKDLDEYFKYLKQQSEDDLRISIFKCLGFEKSIDFKDEYYLKIILERIDGMDFDGDIKWYLIALINNPKCYIEKFVGLIQEYLPLYEELKKKYWKYYQEFVEWVDKKLLKDGINFLDDKLNFMNLKQYEEIHLNYSIFDLITSHILEDGIIHIYIGLIFKMYVEDQENKNDIDMHLNVYKVFSDKTRFEIIKILIAEESYGQEIAERLGITTATVSYHMDYLYATSLIFIKRKGRRLYYSVNKTQIKNSIKFLEKEFGL